METKIEGIIQAGPKGISEYKERKKLGFKIDEVWYNIYGDEQRLTPLIVQLSTGNKVSFEHKDKEVVSPIVILEKIERKPNNNSRGNWNGPKKSSRDEVWLKQQGCYNLASVQVLATLKLQDKKDVDLESIHNLVMIQAKNIHRSFASGEMLG